MTRMAWGAIGWLLGLGLALLMKPGPAPSGVALRVVVDPALEDVAITFPADHTILVNPVSALSLPPALITFLLYHEQAHIALGHRAGAPAAKLQQELAADCWASRQARPEDRVAAIRFFSALGSLELPGHPSGTARALEVARCSP